MTWLLVAAAVAFMTILPILWIFSIAFRARADIYSPELWPDAPTLANFVYVFTRVDFLRYLLNTFFVSTVVTVVALLFHSMAGYALSRLSFAGRETIFIAMFTTLLVSLPVVIVPTFVIARELNLLDSYAGLIIPSIFNAFGIFMLRQYYLSIPREIEEAALVDGASYWTIYTGVILPLSKPIFASLGILFFLANWNSFLWPLTITRNPDLRVIQVAIASFQGQHSGAWNYIMAASVVVIVPVLVIFVVFQRQIMESVKSSGLK